MSRLRSIFLVDDDPDDQYFFIRELGKLESFFLYIVAANGKEALELLGKSDILPDLIVPDLIVMDINMPLMDGLECVTALKKNVHTQYIPVIILSTDTKKMEVALKTGAIACFDCLNQIVYSFIFSLFFSHFYEVHTQLL